MKARGLVLEGKAFRAPLGAVAPPLSLPDVSRFGNNGTFTDVTWVQLPSGLWVMSFNGVSSDINCSNHTSLDVLSLTLCCWLILPATAGYILAKGLCAAGGGGGYGLFWDPANDRIQLYSSGASADSPTEYPERNTYLYLTVTRESNNVVSFFKNGYMLGARALVVTANTGILHIGNYNGASWWFNSNMVLPRIYNYVLSHDEINKHFEAERRLFGVGIGIAPP